MTNYTARLDRSTTPSVIAVVDHCNDGAFMSVTNAAEDVVREVVDDLGDYPIVYRDSMGLWDGLLHERGRFTGFDHLGATTRADAERMARARL